MTFRHYLNSNCWREFAADVVAAPHALDGAQPLLMTFVCMPCNWWVCDWFWIWDWDWDCALNLRFNVWDVVVGISGCSMLAFVIVDCEEFGEEHTDRDKVLPPLYCGGGGGIEVLSFPLAPPPVPLLLLVLLQRKSEIDGGCMWRTNLPLWKSNAPMSIASPRHLANCGLLSIFLPVGLLISQQNISKDK